MTRDHREIYAHRWAILDSKQELELAPSKMPWKMTSCSSKFAIESYESTQSKSLWNSRVQANLLCQDKKQVHASLNIPPLDPLPQDFESDDGYVLLSWSPASCTEPGGFMWLPRRLNKNGPTPYISTHWLNTPLPVESHPNDRSPVNSSPTPDHLEMHHK